MNSEEQPTGDEPPNQTGLTEIQIENFKGIGDLVKVPLRPITLLFGANSAGKSTLIQVLHYAREILTRNNPDADIPLAGGNAIDLGGFRNIVHRHDLTKTIKIGFEIVPDDDGLPSMDQLTGLDSELDLEYWDILEKGRVLGRHNKTLEEAVKTGNLDAIKRVRDLMINNRSLVAEHSPNVSTVASRFKVTLCVRWDEATNFPWVSSLEYGINDKEAFKIVKDNPGAIPHLSFNAKHPDLNRLFTPVVSEEGEVQDYELDRCLTALQDSHGRIPLRGMQSVIPDCTKPLPLGISTDPADADERDYDFYVAAIVNQVVLGSTALLKKELEEFRYIGPIRERPHRDLKPPAVIDEARWADGSAAWDQILKHYSPERMRGDDYVMEISRWLSDEDKLNLGYAIGVTALRGIPDESMLMANLRLLRNQYDEKDEDFYREQIWNEIQNTELRPQLRIQDLRNQTYVGPTDIGMGVIQFIPVLAAALDSEKSLLCVEQPELHLHPAAQANAGDLFISRSKKGKRFIIETHGETLMLRIFRRIRETTRKQLSREELQIKSDDIALLFVSAAPSGTRFTQIRLNDQGKFIDKVPGGFFEEGFDELF